MSSHLINNFKQFDAYAKTLEDFKVKTATGATITVAGVVIMVLLFLSELYTYMSPNISEELFVDTSRGHKLRINFDIIVPSISCSLVDASNNKDHCTNHSARLVQYHNYSEDRNKMENAIPLHSISVPTHFLKWKGWEREMDLMKEETQRQRKHSLSMILFVSQLMVGNTSAIVDVYAQWLLCVYDLVLDAMDSSGEQHLQMDHNIHKRRLDLDGNPIEEPKKEEIAISSTVKQNISELAIITCGSCYGAAFNDSQCCNTCEDVKEAYRVRRWALPDLATIVQCKDDESLEKANLALKEGCQIYGYMEVNRVGGSFHIAPGKSFTINHVHVHDVQPYSSSSFNTTHVIQHLSFGSVIKSANTAPLDGITGLAKEGAVMFQYYIKIVPTMYVKLDKTVLHTNQFSVTRHQKSVSNINSESGMPGAFFSYELSPLMVKYTEKERSIGHFATNVCAIMGGVFTVAGILDTLLYHSLNAFHNKIVLGKAG